MAEYRPICRALFRAHADKAPFAPVFDKRHEICYDERRLNAAATRSNGDKNMAWSDWFKRGRGDAPESGEARPYHSGAYHSYFEGYTEYRVTDERDKSRLRRVYTGDWYRQKLEKKQYIGLRAVYTLLFLVMAGAVALAAFTQGSAGQALYTVAPEIVTLCLLARLFYVLFVNYLFAPRKMTVNDYRTSAPALKTASSWLAALFGADLLGTALDALLNGAAGRFQSLPLTLLAFALGAAAAWLMYRMECRVPYETLKNDTVPPADGVTIQKSKRDEGLRGWIDRNKE